MLVRKYLLAIYLSLISAAAATDAAALSLAVMLISYLMSSNFSVTVLQLGVVMLLPRANLPLEPYRTELQIQTTSLSLVHI